MAKTTYNFLLKASLKRGVERYLPNSRLTALVSAMPILNGPFNKKLIPFSASLAWALTELIAATKVAHWLAALRLDVGRHFNGLDAISIANAKRAYLGAFTDQRVVAHHDVLHDENFRSPFRDFGADVKGLALGRRLHEARVDFQQRRTDDSCGFHQFTPGQHTVNTKKCSEAASIHFEKFGKNTMPAGSQSPN